MNTANSERKMSRERRMGRAQRNPSRGQGMAFWRVSLRSTHPTPVRDITMKMPLFLAVSAVACVAFGLSPSAAAAEWKVQPGLDASETFTDNLTLAPSGAERSDFVTEISPHITLSGTGARLKFNAMYRMRNFFYARENDASNTQHHLQAAAHAELVDELFFVDGKAAVGQQAISAFGPQAVDNGLLAGNRAEIRTYSISPTLRHHFGRNVTAEARYTRDSVDTDAGGLLASRSDRLHLGLNSELAFRTLQWNVLYDQQTINYDHAENVETRMLSGTARYLITPRFSLNATAGHEDNSYVSIGEKPDGGFWSFGATWAPSERTSVSANAGKRFFGNTFSLNSQHRTRRTVWSMSYQEDITTARSQVLVPGSVDTSAFLDQLWSASIPDPLVREQLVSNFIRDTGLGSFLPFPVNSFTNRVFLQKSAHASVAISGVRNTLVVGLFRTEREPQTSGNADLALPAATRMVLDEKTRQAGVTALWNWRLSSRTSATLNAGYNRVEAAATDRQDDNVTVRLGLARQFQPKLKGGMELRHLRHRSDRGDADYRENAIAAFVSIAF